MNEVTENTSTVFLHVYGGKLPITAQFLKDRPYVSEIPKGRYVYDIMIDSHTGEPKWITKAAYRNRLGSIVTDRNLDVSQKIVIDDITFFEQAKDRENLRKEQEIEQEYASIAHSRYDCYEPYTDWSRPEFPNSILSEIMPELFR